MNLHAKVPIIGVVGHKNSGKTTVIESVLGELTRRGHRVATAKRIPQKGVSNEHRGKRHTEAFNGGRACRPGGPLN